MLRFIDLGEQIGSRKFAFFNTVPDQFEEYRGEMTWCDWNQFAEVCDPASLERHRALCPTWVFTEPREVPAA